MLLIAEEQILKETKFNIFSELSINEYYDVHLQFNNSFNYLILNIYRFARKMFIRKFFVDSIFDISNTSIYMHVRMGVKA